jgi:hypothetical protein
MHTLFAVSACVLEWTNTAIAGNIVVALAAILAGVRFALVDVDFAMAAWKQRIE